MPFCPNNPVPQMGSQGFGSMDLEAELEERKEVKRLMEESARATFVAYVDKVKEHTMLTTINQNMVAEEEHKEKFVEKFMVFLEVIDNGDLETLQHFDEKDMMNTISKMMNSDAGDEGGLKSFYVNVVSKIELGLEEKATMDTILATMKTDGSSGSGNGGFFDEYGDDFPKTRAGFEEKAMVKNNGSCGGSKSEFADDYEREGAMVDAIEKPNSDGNGLEAEAPANMVAAANETGTS